MPTRIIIVGGGFVGLPVAKRIARALGKGAKVTMIDPHEKFTFLPRLTDALEHSAEASDVLVPFAPLAERYGFSFVQGTVLNIDRILKKLAYTGINGQKEELSYDYLVYSPGSTTNFYGTPGAEAHCLTLDSWDDVQAIHARVDALIAQAHTADKERKKTLLSFIVVGAGPTGVESVFALQNYVGKTITRIAPGLKTCASYTLIQAAPQILNGFNANIVDGTVVELYRHCVTLLVSEPVVRVNAELVETAHPRRIPAGLVLWAAGTQHQDVPILPIVAKDQSKSLVVDNTLRIYTTFFAGGDAVSYKEQELTVPKNGQTAHLMSRTIAKNVIRAVRGQALKRFRYGSLGTFLPLGEIGFAQLGPFVIKSKLARLIRDFFYKRLFREMAK